jgi:hypothetical protein
MSTNWLETAGSWLAKPFVAVAGPWWDKLVEAKAADLVVREKVLEAIIRFRIQDFARQCSVDPHRATGLAATVFEKLRPRITDDKNLDVTAVDFLHRVEQEIQFQAVTLTDWAYLACLRDAGVFDLNKCIIVQIIHNYSTKTYASTGISSVQDSFPLSAVFFSTSGRATLSDKAMNDIRDFCVQGDLPTLAYEIRSSMSKGRIDMLTNPRKLASGWGPLPDQLTT